MRTPSTVQRMSLTLPPRPTIATSRRRRPPRTEPGLAAQFQGAPLAIQVRPLPVLYGSSQPPLSQQQQQQPAVKPAARHQQPRIALLLAQRIAQASAMWSLICKPPPDRSSESRLELSSLPPQANAPTAPQSCGEARTSSRSASLAFRTLLRTCWRAASPRIQPTKYSGRA